MNDIPLRDALDIDHLRSWIGAEESAEDDLTPALAERFHLTLNLPGEPAREGENAPRLIHFCLCQPVAPMDALGPDGHPARGGFLPPVALPRRMWAGSDLAFTGDLRVGDRVRRRSVIENVVVKEGRSGTLCFVTVAHEVDVSGLRRVEDRQTIVYRALETESGVKPVADPAPLGAAVATIEPSQPLLFRYSALTFNGHRIHYDTPYATGEEGYPGLVVHGPLQATFLYHLAVRQRSGIAPSTFSFRSLSTLFDKDIFCLHAGTVEEGVMNLWTSRPDGPVAMKAQAAWA